MLQYKQSTRMLIIITVLAAFLAGLYDDAGLYLATLVGMSFTFAIFLRGIRNEKYIQTKNSEE